MVDTDRIISLIRTIASDPALMDRLTATAPAERGAVLTEIGYGDVSPADLVGSEALFVAPSVEEIDDEQLAGVAGGGGDDPWPTGVSAVCCAAAAT